MICEIYNICLSLRLRQIIDLQTLTNHDILLKLLLSPEKKNYFENSCNCHTPILLSALFALGKSQFFSQELRIVQEISLGQNIGTRLYGGLINIP